MSNIQIITSRDNALIKKVHALHNAKGRAEQQRFLAEGTRCVQGLLDTDTSLVHIFATEQMLSWAMEHTDHARIVQVTDRVMEKISAATTPSGVLAVFEMPPTPEIETITAGLVLARLTDPGNIGTLVRSAVSFGVRTIVCIEGADPWSPKVVQASAGAIGTVTIHRCSWEQLHALQGRAPLCALVARDGQDIADLKGTNQLLVVGSEAHGIPDEWVKKCELQVTIATTPGVESLNAAIAGSIALYSLFNKR